MTAQSRSQKDRARARRLRFARHRHVVHRVQLPRLVLIDRIVIQNRWRGGLVLRYLVAMMVDQPVDLLRRHSPPVESPATRRRGSMNKIASLLIPAGQSRSLPLGVTRGGLVNGDPGRIAVGGGLAGDPAVDDHVTLLDSHGLARQSCHAFDAQQPRLVRAAKHDWLPAPRITPLERGTVDEYAVAQEAVVSFRIIRRAAVGADRRLARRRQFVDPAVENGSTVVARPLSVRSPKCRGHRIAADHDRRE